MKLAYTPRFDDNLIVVPDYHPEYGLPDSTRAEVLGLVRINGLSVKEAAAQHRLHPSTVNRWLRATKEDI